MEKFVQQSKYNVGLDSAILMNPEVWVASGHVGSFSDPLIDCKECKSRFRADKLIEDFYFENNLGDINVDGWENEKVEELIKEKNICCPSCKKQNFTPIRRFNLMFKTFQGVTEDSKSEIYLRPETAQGILSILKILLELQERKFLLVLHKLGNLLEMKLHQVILLLELVNLNKWN